MLLLMPLPLPLSLTNAVDTQLDLRAHDLVPAIDAADNPARIEAEAIHLDIERGRAAKGMGEARGWSEVATKSFLLKRWW